MKERLNCGIKSVVENQEDRKKAFPVICEDAREKEKRKEKW